MLSFQEYIHNMKKMSASDTHTDTHPHTHTQLQCFCVQQYSPTHARGLANKTSCDMLT